MKKYDLIKEGDPCYVCGIPFKKYDPVAWLDKERYKLAHLKCYRSVNHE